MTKKNLDNHLRCEICDFCAESPSLYNDSLPEASPRPFNVAIRHGKALCNSCYHIEGEISADTSGMPLTTPIGHDKLVYDVGVVKVYPATHPKLVYYEEHGYTDDDKQRWRNEYQRTLMEGCCPFRGGETDES